MSEHMPEQTPPTESELARLADGSLSSEAAARLRALVESSPELAAALAEQNRAVMLLRGLDTPAPARLHAHVEELTAARRRDRSVRNPPSRRFLALPGVALAAVVVAVAVILASGGGAPPTVPQTARVALASARAPAPAVSASDPGQLNVSVGTVAFPYWDTAGWRASGLRTDSLNGRRVVTVFYSWRGRRVGYAIVSGSPLADVSGRTVTDDGVAYTLAGAQTARFVTWQRGGHTCVIAGRRVSDRTLLALAEHA